MDNPKPKRGGEPVDIHVPTDFAERYARAYFDELPEKLKPNPEGRMHLSFEHQPREEIELSFVVKKKWGGCFYCDLTFPSGKTYDATFYLRPIWEYLEYFYRAANALRRVCAALYGLDNEDG